MASCNFIIFEELECSDMGMYGVTMGLVIRNIKIGALLSYLLLSGCIAYKESDYRINDKEPFSINSLNKSLLDTNSVYLWKEDLEINLGTIDTLYHYKRFFSGGQMYWSSSWNKPLIIDDFENFDNGVKCYYKIRKDGILMQETYMGKNDPYMYLFGRINDSSIIFYKEKLRSLGGAKKNIYQEYKKIDGRLVNFKIDW